MSVEHKKEGQQRGLSSPVKVGLKIVFCALLGFGAYLYWAHEEYRIVAVRDGKVYHSSRIPPDEIGAFAKKRDVKTVIDLRFASTETEAERKACEAAGIRYVSIPSSQVPDEETVAAFLRVMDDPSTLPVLMHCYHGEGRAPLFGALYRIEYEGWDPEKARKATRPFAFTGSFSPGSSKGKFLRDYIPRARRTGSSGSAAE
ncbi:MAG: fused DSP-PTPase phosphatase/NAD kinase-like protein [Planctomycetota bacterium]|jgi:protein tyrosine phosphatase (PTP) superfamily phosphohydrolase (DUF442 family)